MRLPDSFVWRHLSLRTIVLATPHPCATHSVQCDGKVVLKRTNGRKTRIVGASVCSGASEDGSLDGISSHC
ncbi:hypothetical protein V8C34DRAFT_148728 [Trichoderma compactum]